MSKGVSEKLKTELRKEYLTARKSSEYHESRHQRLRREIVAWLQRNTGMNEVFLFLSVNNEPDLLSLNQELADSHTVMAPRTEPGGRMNFYTFKEESLVLGKFGLREPDPASERKGLAGKNTLMLLPALAIDKAGNRLGYGGGYYDRYLRGSLHERPVTMGVVWEEFFLDHSLPAQVWDWPVDFIVTENGVRKSENGNSEIS